MGLHNVRDDVLRTLEKRGLSQQKFAERHGISFSWLNKFLREELDNPRYSSLEKLQKAIRAEQRF